MAQLSQRAPDGRAEEKEPQKRAAESQRRHIKTQRPAGGSHAQQKQRRRRAHAEEKICEHAAHGAGALPQDAEQIVEEAQAHAAQERDREQDQLGVQRLRHLSGTAAPRGCVYRRPPHSPAR